MYVAFENDSAGTATPSTTAEEKGYALFFFLPLCQLTGVLIAQLYPKQHKMETQYKADSLLITLAGWAAT